MNTKNIFKKMLSVTLSLVLVATMFFSANISVFATNTTTTSLTDQEITCEDLFITYPFHLTNNVYFPQNNLDTYGATVNIISEYVYTSHFTTSCIVYGIDIATSPTELFKEISDTISNSNFKFNKELDIANQKFVEAVCDVELSAPQAIGKDNKYVKSLNSFVGISKKIDKILVEEDAKLNELSKPELYEDFLDRTIGMLEKECTQLNPKLPSLKSEVYTSLSQAGKIFSTASEVAEFMEALSLSVLMQEAQMELIQEIMDTQPSSSTLYKGMSRLKSQLLNGFSGYFSTTYITDKVYEKVIDTISDNLADWALGDLASHMSALIDIVRVINNIVFKEFLGYDYSEYASAVMLQTYTYDLYSGVEAKAEYFYENYSAEDVKKFETLYNAYIAMRKAAFEECKNLAKHNDEYNTEYVKEKEEAGVFNTEKAFEKYLDAVIAHIKSLSQDNVMVTDRTKGWRYEISKGEVTITGHQNPVGALLIPSEMEDYPVTSIGYKAFSGCTGLTSITIPDSVTTIGNSAFSHCESLTSITIPDSVTSIGDSAFYNCTGLTSVYITDMAAWCEIAFGDFPANPLYHAGKLYLNVSLVTDLVIPDSVTSISSSAFNGCTGLTSVTIPDSVTSIGSSAFNGCTGLTSVTIPDSVTSTGWSAFNGCTGLTSVTIPDSVTSIDGYAFYGCTGLTSVTIPDSVTSIGSSAFYDCRGLTSITIPDSVTSIGGSAFYGCTGLTSVTIPDSATFIGSSAFYGCRGLTSVYITDMAAWCEIAFSNLAANPLYHAGKLYLNGSLVTDLVIPDSVTSIGSSAFLYCTGITSITIPDSVTSIGSSAFYGCTGLTSVTIPDSVTEIGSSAFDNCTGLTSVTIPDSVTSIGGSAFGYCHGLTSITIPDSVTSIGSSAFHGCTGLTSVTIPDSVTSIDWYAFYGCKGLTSITIPDSVTSIGGSAFSWCTSLTSITIPDSVTSIGRSAFYGCDALTIYGERGSYAQEYATKNNIPFVALNQTVLEDTQSGVQTEYEDGSIFESDVILSVEPVEEESVLVVLKDYAKASVLDITLLKNGEAIQPESPLTVRVPVPEGMDPASCHVLHVANDGTVTDMNATLEDNMLVFTVTHLSYYAVVEDSTLLGDVNGDDKVNTTDARVILQYAAGIIDETALNLDVADVTGDGKVNTTDARSILQFAAGIIDHFPAEE